MVNLPNWLGNILWHHCMHFHSPLKKGSHCYVCPPKRVPVAFGYVFPQAWSTTLGRGGCVACHLLSGLSTSRVCFLFCIKLFLVQTTSFHLQCFFIIINEYILWDSPEHCYLISLQGLCHQMVAQPRGKSRKCTAISYDILHAIISGVDISNCCTRALWIFTVCLNWIELKSCINDPTREDYEAVYDHTNWRMTITQKCVKWSHQSQPKKKHSLPFQNIVR